MGPDSDRDLPPLLSPIHIARTRLGARRTGIPIDDGAAVSPCPTPAHESRDMFGVVSHGGAHDAPLIPEQTATCRTRTLGQSSRRSSPSRRAPERAQTIHPTWPRHVLDYHPGAGWFVTGAHLLGIFWVHDSASRQTERAPPCLPTWRRSRWWDEHSEPLSFAIRMAARDTRRPMPQTSLVPRTALRPSDDHPQGGQRSRAKRPPHRPP